MAGAGGHWSKGKFYPAQDRVRATPAQLKAHRTRSVGDFQRNQTGESPIQRVERLKRDYKQSQFSATEAGKKYTPEYRQAQRDMDKVRALYRGKASDEELLQDRDFRDAKDRADAEKEISDIARRGGYDPSSMSKRQWAALSENLESDAKEQLRYADQSDRDAVGNKLRGKKDTYRQVGGQAILTRSGATKKQAEAATRQVDRATQQAGDDYMTDRLSDYGYRRQNVDNLSYDQKRRLLAEIGHGEVQKTKIDGVSFEERQRVIEAAGDRRRLEARSISLNPRAGQGLETWGHAMMAAEKADRDIDLPPDYIIDNAKSSAPQYTRRSNPNPKYQRAEEIDF